MFINEIQTIRTADTDSIREMKTSLAQAFDNDPVLNWFIRDDDLREVGFETFFYHCLSLGLPHGNVMTSRCYGGAAIWYPPEQWQLGLLKQCQLAPAMFRVSGLQRIRRMLDCMSTVEKNHPRNPHYYLQFIGVHPVMGGQGLGSELMIEALRQFDAEGVPSYLENSTEANISFYQRFGYKIINELSLGEGSPTLWCMWRDAK